MNRYKIIMTLIFLLVCFNALIAEEPLILNEEDAVKLGLEQNITLKRSLLTLDSSQETVENNWNQFLPDFSLTAGLSRSEVFLSDSSDDDPWSASFSGDISYSIGFDTLLNLDKNELLLKNQQLLYEITEQELEMNIRKKFKYLLASKQNLTLQEKNIDLAEKRYEQAIINYNNGLISELSLLTIQNSVETLRPTFQDADTSYKQLLMSFQSLLGLDLSQELQLEGNLDVQNYDFEPQVLIDAFLSKRLDISSSKVQIDLGEKTLEITKKENLTPELSLSASWDNSLDTIFDDIEWSDSTTLSAYISVPLNGFIKGSEESLDIADAKRSIEDLELDLQNTRYAAEEEIRSILMELDGSWANIRTTNLSVNLAQKTYEMTEAAFQKGSAELLDVEDAQNKLLSAEQDLLISKYNYLAGILDLQVALNSDINEIIKLTNK